MKIKTLFTLALLQPGLVALSIPAFADDNLTQNSNSSSNSTISTITVQSDLRQAEDGEIAASLAVIDEFDLDDRGARHFDDILLQTPNINFAGGTSRARHLQIRGMGERDAYTGAPNASVGFAIDEIDFSGIGMTGNLFDTKQVEVLRGPQSTRYGASALAGLVNVQTNEPTAERESLLEGTFGSHNTQELGLMTSGAVSEKHLAPQYRLSLFSHQSDGFRQNKTLNRKDTDGKNEFTGRAKLRFWGSENLQFDLSLLHADINNGYDVFTPDNSYNTYSDQPGHDKQRSTAGSFKAQYDGLDGFKLISTTTYATTKSLYDYDGDWGADSDAFYSHNRERDNFSQEVRAVSKQPIFNQSTDWLVGVFASKLDEQNYNRNHEWGKNSASDTDYQLTKTAVFGQLDFHLSAKTTLVSALRLERVKSEFSNSASEKFAPAENLWGGSLSLNQQINTSNSVYAAVSRGYKAGGFNPNIPAGHEAKTYFAKETALNYELGHRFAGEKFSSKTSLFYTDRTDPQFDGNEHLGGGAWAFYTENLDKAQNYGVETELNWRVVPSTELFANLGILQTKVSGKPLNADFTISGRDQSHAPSYQFLAGAQYRNQSWFARFELQGMDSFYFDNVHNEKSRAYVLANARIGYEAAGWEVYLWGKNLTDEEYETRGFYFDLDGSGSKRFVGLGDRRQIGLTTRVRF